MNAASTPAVDGPGVGTAETHGARPSATGAGPAKWGGAPITVNYFAAARAAAGVASETLRVGDLGGVGSAKHPGASAGQPGGTASRVLPSAPDARGALITVLSARHPQTRAGEPALATVLAQSSFLLNGVALVAGAPLSVLEPGARIDVLPPFAGG